MVTHQGAYFSRQNRDTGEEDDEKEDEDEDEDGLRRQAGGAIGKVAAAEAENPPAARGTMGRKRTVRPSREVLLLNCSLICLFREKSSRD